MGPPLTGLLRGVGAGGEEPPLRGGGRQMWVRRGKQEEVPGCWGRRSSSYCPVGARTLGRAPKPSDAALSLAPRGSPAPLLLRADTGPSARLVLARGGVSLLPSSLFF